MSTSEMENNHIIKMITLRSSDNDEFSMEEKIAVQSLTIKNMVEDGCASQIIPLPNVPTPILVKIIQFLKQEANDDERDKNNDLIENLDITTEVFEVIVAADYLNIPSLMNAACEKAAKYIDVMNVEEAREFFGIQNDYTPEYEAQVRHQISWLFQ